MVVVIVACCSWASTSRAAMIAASRCAFSRAAFAASSVACAPGIFACVSDSCTASAWISALTPSIAASVCSRALAIASFCASAALRRSSMPSAAAGPATKAGDQQDQHGQERGEAKSAHRQTFV